MEKLAAVKKDFTTGFAFAFIAVVLWSGNFIVARALRQSVPPVSLSFFRWLIATAVLFPIAFKNLKTDFSFLKKHLLYLGATALTGVAIFNTLLYVSGKYVTAMNMALLGTSAAPVFVLIISAVLLRLRLSIYQWIGAIVCIIGILILISGGNLDKLKNFRFGEGDWWVLAAALSFAIYTLLVRKKPVELSATGFLFSIFFLGTLFLLPFYSIEKSSGKTFDWTTTNILIFLYLGIGASVIAFLYWNLSIKKIGAPRTALFGNLIPVFSSIEAALILNETFTAVTLISFAVILAGLALANFPALRK